MSISVVEAIVSRVVEKMEDDLEGRDLDEQGKILRGVIGACEKKISKINIKQYIERRFK